MLYDQAQLVLAFVEAAQASGDRFFADVALDTLDYVRRDMTDPAGGFYSAEDADSIPPERAGEAAAHKTEGAFYVWQDAEIARALGPDADLVRMRFGILPDGNAPFDPHNEFTHKNLLYTARSMEEIVAATDKTADAVAAALDRSRLALRDVRARRPKPHLDDKVLTAWNGLMIAGFARAARILDNAAGCVDDAQRAAGFIRSALWNPVSRTLHRRYRHGESGIDGYAEDYAYLIFGLLELFQADGDVAWLEWAIDLQRRQDDLFWDDQDGGWFSTTGRDPSVLLRMKEDYDGAEPAASSVSVLNLLVLAHLTGDPTFADRLERALATFGGRAAALGRAVPMFLAGLSTYHAGMPQIVVAGERSASEPMLAVLRRRYLPTAIIIRADPERREQLTRALPWTEAMLGVAKPAVFICRDFVCERPITSPAELEAAVDAIVNHES
jgi:uncharacterized protein YyaL (SSP411 family)